MEVTALVPKGRPDVSLGQAFHAKTYRIIPGHSNPNFVKMSQIERDKNKTSKFANEMNILVLVF